MSLSEEEKLVQAGKYSLIDFSIVTGKYSPNWHHELIADKLEAIERGELKRLMIFMPPRHGKSQLATINFPAWYLGRHPDGEIITVSYSGDLAMDFGGKTRDKIADESYGLVFDNLSLKEDEKSKGKWKTNKEDSYLSAGIGGAITGRGADILIVDDPIKNREEAESKVFRKKVWDFYTSTAYTRLNPGGAIIVILTRWHLDDLAGRLLTKSNEYWEILDLPAIAVSDEEHRKKAKRYGLHAIRWKDCKRLKKR